MVITKNKKNPCIQLSLDASMDWKTLKNDAVIGCTF